MDNTYIENEKATSGKSETKNAVTTVKKHRVGTITTGLSLIGFGTMFIVSEFAGTFTYIDILKLWPIIIISLGLEVLIGAVLNKEKFIYDKGGIFITALMLFFAMGMGFFYETLKYIAIEPIIIR